MLKKSSAANEAFLPMALALTSDFRKAFQIPGAAKTSPTRVEEQQVEMSQTKARGDRGGGP